MLYEFSRVDSTLFVQRKNKKGDKEVNMRKRKKCVQVENFSVSTGFPIPIVLDLKRNKLPLVRTCNSGRSYHIWDSLEVGSDEREFFFYCFEQTRDMYQRTFSTNPYEFETESLPFKKSDLSVLERHVEEKTEFRVAHRERNGKTIFKVGFIENGKNKLDTVLKEKAAHRNIIIIDPENQS